MKQIKVLLCFLITCVFILGAHLLVWQLHHQKRKGCQGRGGEEKLIKTVVNPSWSFLCKQQDLSVEMISTASTSGNNFPRSKPAENTSTSFLCIDACPCLPPVFSLLVRLVFFKCALISRCRGAQVWVLLLLLPPWRFYCTSWYVRAYDPGDQWTIAWSTFQSICKNIIKHTLLIILVKIIIFLLS